MFFILASWKIVLVGYCTWSQSAVLIFLVFQAVTQATFTNYHSCTFPLFSKQKCSVCLEMHTTRWMPISISVLKYPHTLTQRQHRRARNTDKVINLCVLWTQKNNLNTNINPNVIQKKRYRQLVYTGQFERCDFLKTLIIIYK